jgi:molecular chaperone DnaJ
VNHYRTLQVTRDADAEVIERAYKALSLKYHPDRVAPGERERATRRMQVINEAYSVLRDPVQRRAYDAQLPPEGAEGWDRFMEVGLFGLVMDRFAPRSRPRS